MRWAPAPSRRDGLRWWVGRHRRVLAALLAGAAVWAGLTAVRVRQPPTVGVLVAARDLVPGAVLSGADLRTVRLPAGAVPPSALRPGTALAGRSLAVAVPAGVPLTPASLSVSRLLPAGTEATPVRLADPGETALVTPGDRVDVLAAASGDLTGVAVTPPTTDNSSSPPAVVAADVAVLAVPAPDGAAGDAGGLLVLAATPAQAVALARAAAADRLSVAVRRS